MWNGPSMLYLVGDYLSVKAGSSVKINHTFIGMTDPSAADTAPPKPPRPTAAQRQLEADELYARQLAEHYNRRAPPAQQPYSERPRRGSDLSDEREYSFFDGILTFLPVEFLS